MKYAEKRIPITLTQCHIFGTKTNFEVHSPSIGIENVEKYERRTIHFPIHTNYNIHKMFSKKGTKCKGECLLHYNEVIHI
jgi:hypothetical protein